MKRKLLIIVMIAIGLTLTTAALLRSSATPKATEMKSEDLLAQLANYRQWALVNPVKAIMDQRAAAACAIVLKSDTSSLNPHSKRYISVYVNRLGEEAMMKRQNPVFPEGSIIVKEKFVNQFAREPELLTVMVKRKQGYSVVTGDWEYVVLDGSASKIADQGTLTKCNSCHLSYKDSDYVTRTYLPREVRQKLE